MQFSTILFIFSAGLSAASPLQERQLGICSNALQTPKCCGMSMEGIANMNCDSPSSTPSSTDDFKDICDADGKTASCCMFPLAGQALMCDSP